VLRLRLTIRPFVRPPEASCSVTAKFTEERLPQRCSMRCSLLVERCSCSLGRRKRAQQCCLPRCRPCRHSRVFFLRSSIPCLHSPRPTLRLNPTAGRGRTANYCATMSSGLVSILGHYGAEAWSQRTVGSVPFSFATETERRSITPSEPCGVPVSPPSDEDAAPSERAAQVRR
jgi:hypothetical protein